MHEHLRKLGAHNGLGDPGSSRYIVLYLAQFAWLAIGFLLYRAAQWPSTCTPQNLIELYTCSPRLPESGRWLDGGLLTWLWITPMLLILEGKRRFGGNGE